MSNKEGAYYAKLYLTWVKGYKREVEDLYDKNLDVQVAIDLGMNDTNVLTVFQEYTDGIRVIDEVVDNGEKISYYTDILKEKLYFKNITHVILPHDAEVREQGTGKTRTQVFEGELPGVDITVLERVSRNEGIEAVRQMLTRMWIDPKRCGYLVSCLFNYRKEYDDKRNRWKDTPEHDEYSNGADSLRYVALGSRVRNKSQRRRKPAGHDV